MRYVIEILNSAGVKVAQLSGSECSCKVHRKINNDWSITIRYIVPPEGQGEDKSGYLLAFYRARLIDIDNASDYQTFVFGTPEKSHDSLGPTEITISGDHILIHTLRNIVIRGVYDFKSMNVTNMLAAIAPWCPGSIISAWSEQAGASSKTASVLIRYESCLSAIQKIHSALGLEWDYTESTKTFYSALQLGSSAKYINIKPERNLQSIRLKNYSNEIVNKVYGVGGGEYPCTIDRARHEVLSATSSVLTMKGNKVVPENDNWNPIDANHYYAAYFITGSWVGLNTYLKIIDCAHGTTSDTLTIDADLTGVQPGDKIAIAETLDGGSNWSFVDYINSVTSISANNGGTAIEAVRENPEHIDLVNLLLNGFMDGTYTAGLCAGWTKISTPVVYENTALNRIKYGTKSQIIQTSIEGKGIYQSVDAQVGKMYTASAWVYIETGAMAFVVEAVADSSANVTLIKNADALNPETGWQRFDISFIADHDEYKVGFVKSGSGASSFYVDAVQFAECQSADTFVSSDGKKDLWDECFDVLIKAKDPLLSYGCIFVDLYRMSPSEYPFDKIDIGDTVTITDSSLGISGAQARVTEINFDPFKPELTEHTVSNEAV